MADELVLAEYKQIKSEQVARINTRDNLVYVTLVAIASEVESAAACSEVWIAAARL